MYTYKETLLFWWIIAIEENLCFYDKKMIFIK